MRLATAMAWLVSVMLAGMSAGHAEKRVALVIGNAGYRNTPPLATPVNDAEDVAGALQRVGFSLILERDLTKRGMEAALAQFARQAQDADIALVYFAGHSMVYAGSNYLMPVDAKLEDEFSVNFELMRMDDVLFALDRARGVKVLVLDACRNNPLTDQLSRRTASRGLAMGRGLARIEAGRGMVIAYSTQPNQIAVDGSGRNSPFAQAFVREVAVPGLEISALFRRVALQVNRETGGSQMPELSMSLLQEVYLNAGPTDLQAWDRIRNTTDKAALRDFIAQYPESVLASDARQRLAAIEREAADRPAREQAAEARETAQRLAREEAERQRLEAERLANQKAAAEAARETAAQQERERIAAASAAREQAAKREPPVPPETQTAMTSPPAEAAPAVSPTPAPVVGVALIREIKRELKRVGCYAGPLDDDWTTARTRSAIERFARFGQTRVAVAAPTVDLLDLLRAKSDHTCPIECNAREVPRNGRCVAKTCPAGSKLGANGDCERERTTPNSAAPAQPAGPAAHRADLTSCSGNRDACVRGTTSRGETTANCLAAYQRCLKSGVWDTIGTGSHGRRVDGVARR